MMPIFLTSENLKELEYELIPDAAKVKLTRILRHQVADFNIDEPENLVKIRHLNSLINKARGLKGEGIYILKLDDWGDLNAAEVAWHESEFENIFRRLDASEFIEFLAEIVYENNLTKEEANQLLHEANSSARLVTEESGKISISISPATGNVDLDEQANPNLRTLTSRMDNAIRDSDYSAALLNSASAIEVISKEVLSNPRIQDKTFGSYFESYKNNSTLPEPIIDWMLEIYSRRNEEPLAGHGKIESPSISGEEAVIIAEMTKAFLRYERWVKTNKNTI